MTQELFSNVSVEVHPLNQQIECGGRLCIMSLFSPGGPALKCL